MKSMGLQEVFYLVATIALALQVIILIVVAVLIFMVVRKVNNLVTMANMRIGEARDLAENAGEFGAVMAGKAISKVSSMMGKKKRKSNQ